MEDKPKYDFVMQASFFPHRALLRDTQQLHQIAQRIDQLSPEQRRLLMRWYGFYWNMMEQHHHAEDDIMFYELEKRMNQPSEVIEGMEVEHNRLQFLIDEIKRLLGEAMREQKSVTGIKTSLTKYTSELLQLFTSHISKEEKYIRRSVTTYFTPDEQQRIEERVKRKAPFRYLSYMIPWLHESLTDEENKFLDRSLPYTVKWLNRFFWKGRYERIAKPVKEM